MTRAARPATAQATASLARNRYLGLFVVCVGALVGPLDTAVNVAFPALTTAFGLALRDIQWVVIPFAIAQSGLSLVFGRLGDVYGHRRIFGWGMAACVVTHLAAGFAPDYGWLVALRVLQGAAVALAVACGPALATLLFAPEDKRRILAIYVTAFSFGLAIGPLAGGVLVEWLGWPGVFWFRAPLALLALALLPLLADARAPVGPQAHDRAGSRAHAPADAAPRARAGWAKFRATPFATLQLAAVAINFACFAILLLVPYALELWPGQSTSGSGALIALFPGGSLLGGLLAGRFAARVPAARMMNGGLLAAALGLLLTALVLPALSALALGIALLATGIGLGFFQVGYFDATTSILPPGDRGLAGSLVTVTRLLGIVLGVSGIGALHERLGSFQTSIATMGAGLLAFALVAALLRRRRS